MAGWPTRGLKPWDTALKAYIDFVVDRLGLRVDGHTDHGDVSGSVTFTGPSGTHVFDATGATTITLDGFSEGQVASLLCFSGAENVIVTGLPDLVLTDGLVVSALLSRGVWVTGGGGGTPAEPVPDDTTPPPAVTTLVATGGEGQMTLNWTAVVDPESPVSYAYRVWRNSNGASGTWTTVTGTTATVTGLSGGDYTAEVYSYSAGGTTTPDTAEATVTIGPDAFATSVFLDTFNRANATLTASPTPDVGPVWTGNTSSYNISSGKISGTGTIKSTHGVPVTTPLLLSATFTLPTTGTPQALFNARGLPAENGPRFLLKREAARTYLTLNGGGTVTFNNGNGQYDVWAHVPGHNYSVVQTVVVEIIYGEGTWDAYVTMDGGTRTRILSGTNTNAGLDPTTVAFQTDFVTDNIEVSTL